MSISVFCGVPLVRFLAFLALGLLGLEQVGLTDPPRTPAASRRKFVVVTDIEPDDRIGFHLLAYYLIDHEIGLVGTSLLNSARKRALTERTFKDLGLRNVPVLQGTGGTASSYPAISSSEAAREYQREGQGILTEAELNKLASASKSGIPFQEAFISYLEENSRVEVLVLTSPVDIVAALKRRPDLISKIQTFHVMGGWVVSEENGQKVLRSTFNWNMSPQETNQLLELSAKVRFRLYSSHMIKQAFLGGSVSKRNMPDVLASIEEAKPALRGLQDFEVAARSWDEGIIEKIPRLRETIGAENIGRQFTPADPALVVSVFRQNLLETSVTRATLTLDEKDLNPDRGYRVSLVPSEAPSAVEVVEAIDVPFFRAELIRAFTYLPSVVENRLRSEAQTQAPIKRSDLEILLNAKTPSFVLVENVGQNLAHIARLLETQDPTRVSFLLDATDSFSQELARMARRQRFRIVGFATKKELNQVASFGCYDDFLVLSNRTDLSRAVKSTSLPTMGFSKEIGQEVFISFHTNGQSLEAIEQSLSAIAKAHPRATLVHGFLPRSQIHYLRDDLQPIVTRTLDLLDEYFPSQLFMRSHYVGLGDTRIDTAKRAARNGSPVYIVGNISGGVGEEAMHYIKAGANPMALALGEHDLARAMSLSYASDCMAAILAGARSL